MENDSLITETERIIDKYSDKLCGAIESLAGELQVPSEAVFEILVKQQVVNAALYAILLGLGTLLIPIAFKLGIKQEKDNGWDYPQLYGVFCIIVTCISCITLGVGLAHLDVIITGFVNPEYTALMEIKLMFK